MTIICPQCGTENPSDSRYCKFCSASLSGGQNIDQTKTLKTPAEELREDSIFAGRYRIIKELGRGGMGRVYKVLDKKLNEEIAVKLIRPEIASDRNTIERFRNEVRLARKIVHKNVGRVFDLNEDDEKLYITMEYVPGEDLKSILQKNAPLSPGRALSIIKQVSRGLAEAHGLGVIHRDLKPGNIIIDKEGNARIMDFGIARSTRERGITETGMVMGTPEYLSPEQSEGLEADQRSDIYSLGIILYEMTTGQTPFDGNTPLSIALKHKTKIPPSPNKVNRKIPRELSHVILKCLEKDPAKRYQKIEELISDLECIENKKIIPKTKNFSRLLKLSGLFFLAAAVIAGGYFLLDMARKEDERKSPSLPPSAYENSIAVLPFVDLSAKRDQQYFCDGMTEEIIGKLAKIGRLKVISRTSVWAYKETFKDVKDIGEELNVRTILEGSIRKENNNIRISAQLVETRSGFHLWSETYDEKLESIFTIQAGIARSIAEALRIQLMEDEKDMLVKRSTGNLEAYNIYLKGRYFWNKRTPEGYQKSLSYFRQALKEDPTFALAYTGVADYYNLMGYYNLLAPKDAFPKAKEAALKALEIDRELAEAHNSLAMVKENFDWDWEGAEKEYRKAIQISPNYATAHQWYAGFLGLMEKHEESLTEHKKAHQLNPLSSSIASDMGLSYLLVGDYDQAILQYQESLELDPNNYVAHALFGLTYTQKGMYQEGVAQAEKALELSGPENSLIQVFLGVIYCLSGNKEEAEKVLETLNKQSEKVYVTPWGRALIYMGLGKKDQAFAWLDKAYEVRDNWLPSIKVLPIFEDLQSDPRYRDLLNKMGF